MKKTALAVMVGTLAMAGTAHSETELGVGLGLYKMDSSRDVDNDVAGKISLGYRYDSMPWGAEIAYTDVSAEDDADASFDASLFQVDGLYHFDKQGGWEPYLAAGIGEIRTDSSSGKDSDGFINFGGGARYALSSGLDLRADLRSIRTDDTDANDMVATLSLIFKLGEKDSGLMPVNEDIPLPQGPIDSDGDGVMDPSDLCPDTPAGTPVDAAGCPLDSDADGVTDDKDQCPDTAPGLKVDSSGCPMLGSEVVSFNLDVEFETDSAQIRPGFQEDIEDLAEFLTEFANTQVLLGGHTDSVGSAAYNQTLSQKRADAVKRALVWQGIDASRIEAVGFGEARPIADNATRAGREQNRRVVASVSAVVQKDQMK